MKKARRIWSQRPAPPVEEPVVEPKVEIKKTSKPLKAKKKRK